MADIQIMVWTMQTDWFSCQVCDSVTLALSFFNTQSSPSRRIVFTFSFCSAVCEHSVLEERGGAGAGTDGHKF